MNQKKKSKKPIQEGDYIINLLNKFKENKPAKIYELNIFNSGIRISSLHVRNFVIDVISEKIKKKRAKKS